jgi:hypothetical protein
MAGLRPIRWLHLSDLHLGCRGEDLWWQVHEVLERSIRSLAERLGPPDLLLISAGPRSDYIGFRVAAAPG